MGLSNIIIHENSTVLDTMKMFNNTGNTFGVITEGDNLEGKLKAVVTDGDIRRHIVNGGSLEMPVRKIANYSPLYITRENRTQAKEIMKKYSINTLPVVDSVGKVIALVFANELEITDDVEIDAPVVIMAGGLGTRLYPYTKILPKPLIPLGEIPITEHIINRFIKYGGNTFYMIVNHKKNMIKSYFNELSKDYCLNFIDEDKPLGTGGGLSLLKGRINKTFFFTNCDILVDADYADIFNYHKSQDNMITMVCAFKHISVPYGVINLDKNGKVDTMVEKPEYTFLTNTGMYVVEPGVILEMDDGVPVSFPDLFDKYRLAGKNVGVYPISEHCWMDMGQLEELEEMRKKLEGE
jgi:dTDP-glucose pyrophosphorylase